MPRELPRDARIGARDEALDHRGGLLGAYRLHGNGQGTSLGWEVLESDPLGSEESGDLWIHLERTAPKARAWVEKHARIPSGAWPAMFSDDPRPRLSMFDAEEEGEVPGFVVILRGVNLNKGADVEDMVSVRVWIDEHRIITLRRRKIATIAAIRDRLLKGTGPDDSAEFVSRLANGLTERILPVLDAMDQRMDDAEEALSEGQSEGRTGIELRGEIASLRRRAIQLRRYAQPQRQVLYELARSAPEWFDRHDRSLMHESADGAARVVDGIDEIRARASAAYEELTVLAGERSSEQSARLTMIATVFLPLGLIAGIWGMNVPGLPWARHENGLWMVMGLMAFTVLASAVVAMLITRRG